MPATPSARPEAGPPQGGEMPAGDRRSEVDRATCCTRYGADFGGAASDGSFFKALT
ncbi:hypothetical protein GCM10010451_19980 [Streptomyces virens]|uniref:Uncharacterized protein n=1 Tax=Streptomyces virens TaxID=285572 RepID=A0ABP6P8P9_9ACTN